jgi:transposase
MIKFTHDERVELILLYGESGRCQRRAIELYRQRYPTKPVPTQSALSKLVKKFKETGSVSDKRRTGRPKTATGAEATSKTIATVSVCGRTSVRQLSARVNISHASVHRILRKNHFLPYKVQQHQKLDGDDAERRIAFCSELIDEINHDHSLLYRLLLSDESCFFFERLRL